MPLAWDSLKQKNNSYHSYRKSRVLRKGFALGIEAAIQRIEDLRKYISRTPLDTDVVQSILSEVHSRILAELPKKKTNAK